MSEMELTVQDVERIIVTCKPGTAEYVANDVYRQFASLGIQVLHHGDTVEIVAQYISAHVADWLQHSEAVTSFVGQELHIVQAA